MPISFFKALRRTRKLFSYRLAHTILTYEQFRRDIRDDANADERDERRE